MDLYASIKIEEAKADGNANSVLSMFKACLTHEGNCKICDQILSCKRLYSNNPWFKLYIGKILPDDTENLKDTIASNDSI